jgi:hypothetical protein
MLESKEQDTAIAFWQLEKDNILRIVAVIQDNRSIFPQMLGCSTLAAAANYLEAIVEVDQQTSKS